MIPPSRFRPDIVQYAWVVPNLEEAARRKEDDMLGIRIDPLFKGLRADTRYLAIVRREGFVPAATSGA